MEGIQTSIKISKVLNYGMVASAITSQILILHNTNKLSKIHSKAMLGWTSCLNLN